MCSSDLQTPGSPRMAMDDVRSQLAHLVPGDLFARFGRARIASIPRYLRGISIRLERLPHGPQKDQQKGGELAPLWRAWIDRKEALRQRAGGGAATELDAFHWQLEELRIAVFAPELKASALSPQRLSEMWRAIASH